MVEDLKPLNILGIMSGTSLDGLDLALCRFSRSISVWKSEIIKATTLPYPNKLRISLNNAIHLPADELCKLDHEYGRYIGIESKKFLSANKLKADYIASHGHTIFHQPEHRFTLQIGNGHDIKINAGIPVVFDFRSMDVALGGQGAPLVPVGDEYLFSEYDFCLNLGGFSNISYKSGNQRVAFDICPVNMGLNYLAGKLGLDYDVDGNSGKSGKINYAILEKLNNLSYYRQNPPKSLGREWFIRNIQPVIESRAGTIDTLRTFYEHVAIQISNVLNQNKGKNVLITGGGAKNIFLIGLLKEKTACEIVLPDTNLIDFKEALIFALMAYLKVHNIPNVFSSVTGCERDHCGGVLL